MRTTRSRCLAVLGWLSAVSGAWAGAEAAGPAGPPLALVEAESFADCGGWVVDTQCMDQMGSPFLLAHGLGTPVRDATTSVAFPKPGTYRVLVRTRDWVANWKVAGAPGRFQLLVNGRALPTLFGTEGATWHWQDGGSVEIGGPKVTLALHDLTGFDGRCDAILFVADPRFTPPNAGDELLAFRRRSLGLPEKPADGGRYDLVVVGGGMAGTCAAVSAARLGVSVALVHDRPVLGGNNSSEVRVGLSGKIHQEPYPALGDLVKEIGPIGHHDFLDARKHPELPESKAVLALDPIKEIHNAGPATNYEDDKKLGVVQAEKNLRLFLNTHAYAVEKQGPRMAAVLARDTRSSREIRLAAPLFADCTGDGNLGFLAGADYRVGRESRAETSESLAPEEADRLVMGTSVQWYTSDAEGAVEFPACPWGVAFNEQSCQRVTRGDWDWETGMNRDQIADFEQVRDYALRVVYGNWSFLKNEAHDREKYARKRLAWVAYVGGKRESRRLLGPVILQQQDIQGPRAFPDACVTCTWSIDLHYASPAITKYFPGEEFRSVAKHARIEPYAIPYRCLYSRNVENLMMAGRQISVTHVALGTIRVQKTTGMMGEVLGMAASLCKRHGTLPDGVYSGHLRELQELLKRGVGRQGLGITP